jgi:hypothetical protein
LTEWTQRARRKRRSWCDVFSGSASPSRYVRANFNAGM